VCCNTFVLSRHLCSCMRLKPDKAHARLYKYRSVFITRTKMFLYILTISSTVLPKSRCTLNARHTHGCTNTVLFFTSSKMFVRVKNKTVFVQPCVCLAFNVHLFFGRTVEEIVRM